MRLLILDQFSEPGGAQQCVQDLAPEIVRRGWQATFAAPGNGAIFGTLEKLGLRSECLPGGLYTNGRKTLWDVLRYGFDTTHAIFTVRRLINRARPDLIYVNGPRALPAGIACPCPIVFHAHSRLDKRYARLLTALCLRIKRVEVISASYFARRPMESSVRAGHIRVVYTGVRDMGFVSRSSVEPTIRVGIIGRIAPEKGQLDFVRAARLLSEGRRRKIEFVVYGSRMFSESGYEEQVRAEAGGLPVRFAGWTQDVGNALHDTNILAVPSGAIEAAGRVIIEAFSAGTPVVAYSSGGIPELICDCRTGLLTARSTPAALAESIERLLADRAMALRIAHDARREWESRFRIERFQREVCDFLELVAAGRSSGVPPRALSGTDQSAGRFTPRLQSLAKISSLEFRDHAGAQLLHRPLVT